jgi:hypothetical protein
VSGVLTEERVLEGTSDEGKLLNQMDGQEGGSAVRKEWKERCWMRFLKGMVTDRNTFTTLSNILSIPLIH